MGKQEPILNNEITEETYTVRRWKRKVGFAAGQGKNIYTSHNLVRKTYTQQKKCEWPFTGKLWVKEHDSQLAA